MSKNKPVRGHQTEGLLHDMTMENRVRSKLVSREKYLKTICAKECHSGHVKCSPDSEQTAS